MARDRANINTAIWTDDDWRDLTRDEHWLYTTLLTSPALSYAGVTDWRPGRIAQNSSDTTAEDVERIGNLLEEKRFIFIDPLTEEVLIRSFLRHDGLLKQPKLAVSMVNAYGATSSKLIRKVVIHELRRLHDEHPEWRAFGVAQVNELLKLSGSDMSEFTPGLTPGFTPNADQAQALPTSTATTTTTEAKASGSPRKRGTRIPEDFTVTADMIAWAQQNTPDVNGRLSTQKFVNYWTAKTGKDATKLDWVATWRNWMLSDQERAAPADGGLTSSEKRIAQNAAALHSYEPTVFENPFEQKAIQA